MDAAASPFERQREALVAHLRREGIRDERVLEAMATVPRESFVPASLRDLAYEDAPQPIGHRQTISQPYVVALMTELLGVRPGDRVLEVGTGSGYQAAILAAIGCEVFSMEVVPELAESARRALEALGLRVDVRVGDGAEGWPEEAPFDGILVTAAPESVPPALLEQLAPGARLVVPVGGAWDVQALTVLTREPDGSVDRREVAPVRFVPLVRERLH